PCQRLSVLLRNEKTVLSVTNNFGNSPDACRDQRATRGERFQDGVWKAVDSAGPVDHRGHDYGVRHGEHRWNQVVREAPDQLHRAEPGGSASKLVPQFTVSHYGYGNVLELSGGVDEVSKALHLCKPADRDREERVTWSVEPGSYLGTRGGRLEYVRIHSEIQRV